jgi:vancomycin resistance protein YoaR
MIKKNIKSLLCVILCTVLIVATFAACSLGDEEVQATTTTTTEPTTTTTTIVTTTEDTDTTFAEDSTRKIYAGLVKDADGSYPYKIATYTTTYRSSDETRTANLKAAVSKINNIKIPNGSVFSFNQTVGKRTVTAGYETATVIKDGEFVDGLGGGVCQVSSTVFECVLRANVDIVSRTNHSLEISYVPLGGDATVQWNSKDFQFKNTLGCDIRLTMTCNNGNLTCTVYAKENVNVGDVKINIKKSDNQYILTRTVNGKQNYRTTSVYKTS